MTPLSTIPEKAKMMVSAWTSASPSSSDGKRSPVPTVDMMPVAK